MRRPLLDLSAQFIPIFGQVIDRALLTGIIVHRLGVDQFERWSLIVATTSILTMLDLGTQTTFFNRMSRASNIGNPALAARIYRESNTIFAGLAMLVLGGVIAFACSVQLQHFLGFDRPLSASEQLVALFVGGSIAVKMAVSNSNGAYRANHAYAKGTLILALAELFRSITVVAAVLFWPTLIATATATLFASMLPYLLYIPFDLGRRFPLFRYGLAWPTKATTENSFRDSAYYASGFLPSIVLTQIPVLIIGGRAATGVLASFLLLRTFTSLLRTVVLRFANVLGMELGKLEAQGRKEEMRELYTQSTQFTAYLFGLAAGLSLVWGDVLIGVWTGSSRFFNPLILAIMMAPLVLTPRVQIAASFVTYSHRPASLAMSVVVQTALAAALAIFLPIDNLALRFTIAIYGAELISLPPILYPAVGKALGIPVLVPAIIDVARAMGIALCAYVLGRAFRSWWAGPTGMVGSSLVIGLMSMPLFYLALKPLIARAQTRLR